MLTYDLVSEPSCRILVLQTKQLAEEIIAHIRDVAGADALVSAFTAAKKAVSAVRNERKRRAAVQVTCYAICLHAEYLVHGYLLCNMLFGFCLLRMEPAPEGKSLTLPLHLCLAACSQVLVDPEAAARNKLHKQERRAAGRKRKMEDMQRRRGAGVAVKNKKKQKSA